MIGCYFDPTNTTTTNIVFAAIMQHPISTKLLVAGNLNVDLYGSKGNERDKAVVVALAMEGLEDMSARFLILKTKH